MGTQLQHIEPAASPLATTGVANFDQLDSKLRVFESIPPLDHDVVVLGGIVAVFDTQLPHIEGIVEGAYYVRESQHPVANMSWEQWLRLERDDPDSHRRAQPRSPLKVTREVVQAIRWPHADNWALRLASGGVDGPYHEWAFGTDLIGKVVGIFRPLTTPRES